LKKLVDWSEDEDQPKASRLIILRKICAEKYAFAIDDEEKP